MLSAVDSVLKKYGRHGVPENIKGQVTLSAMKHMFESSHFSVCKVDELAKQNDIVFEQEHKDLFNTLHCVNFSEMTQETREYLFALLIDYFRANVVMANTSYGDTDQ